MKNIKLGKLTALEHHSGILNILIILNERKELNFQAFISDYSLSPTTLYRTLGKIKELGLVKQRSDNTSYPPRNMISLTEKGKKVAAKLKEIEEIL